MNVRIALFGAAFAALLASFAACGSSSPKTVDNAKTLAQTPASTTVTATSSPPASPAPSEYGPVPILGGNITKISPDHASKIAQALTTSPDGSRPRGLCAEVNFKDLPENAQWFRMAFDGAEVTTKLTWIVASRENPQDGKVCYAPTAGFTVGRHSAAISVQDPRNPSTPTRQIVSWVFDVIP